MMRNVWWHGWTLLSAQWLRFGPHRKVSSILLSPRISHSNQALSSEKLWRSDFHCSYRLFFEGRVGDGITGWMVVVVKNSRHELVKREIQFSEEKHVWTRKNVIHPNFLFTFPSLINLSPLLPLELNACHISEWSDSFTQPPSRIFRIRCNLEHPRCLLVETF